MKNFDDKKWTSVPPTAEEKKWSRLRIDCKSLEATEIQWNTTKVPFDLPRQTPLSA
jgi:hypothetical protein